jgi:hypothetical protein
MPRTRNTFIDRDSFKQIPFVELNRIQLFHNNVHTCYDIYFTKIESGNGDKKVPNFSSAQYVGTYLFDEDLAHVRAEAELSEVVADLEWTD